jgi:hypothetical protein
LVGWNNGGTTTNSYWDIETSGQSTSDGGTGKTTAEMKTQSTYTNWDFVNIWAIKEGVSYPYLQRALHTTPPSVIVNSPMNITYATSSIPVNATVTDASGVSTVLAEIDGSNNVTLVLQAGSYVNNTVSFTPDGSHRVRIYANDTVGNMNSSEVVFFTVDTTPPSVVINSPMNMSYAASSVTINATVTDLTSTVSTVLAEIDGTYNVTLVKQSNYYVNDTVSFTPDGSHHVRIFANDTVGNTNLSQIVHFTVDTTSPYLISYSPTNHTFQLTNSVDINFRVNDTTSGVNTGLVVFKVDGSPVVPTVSGSDVNGWTFNFTATGLSYEWHNASITVPDMAGNTAAWFIEFATTSVPAISASQTVPAGASTVVGNSTIGVSANVTTTTGSPVVTVANYTGNPAGPATFSALGKYVDVHLDDAAGVSGVEIRVYYADADVANAGLNESLLKLYWWDGTSWLECSNTGVDTAANYIWAKIDQTSTPNVSQLTGAPFGGGQPPSTSVGGFDVAPNYLVVFLGLAGPWIIAVAASAVAIAVVFKARRHGDDAEA